GSVGAAVREGSEPDLRQARTGQLVVGRRKASEHARGGPDVAEASGEDVLDHRRALHEIELLKDHADLPADLPKLAGAGAGDEATAYAGRSIGRLHDATQRAQETVR